MPNKLLNLDTLLYEHEAIRAHIRSVTDSSYSHKSIAGIIGSKLGIGHNLTFNLDVLKVNLANIKKGLQRHRLFEEEILPVYVGSQLMSPILLEHQKITQDLKDLNQLILSASSADSNIQRELIRVKFNGFSELVTSHCIMEDVLLKVLKQKISREVLV